MKRTTIAYVVLLAVLGTAGCGQSPARTEAAGTAGPAAPRSDAARQELSFLVGMIPHHAQAVDMAKLGLTRSRDPRVRALCRDIVEVQTREIAAMRGWAVNWYATVPSEVVSALHSADGEAGEGGMLKDETMTSLGTLRGKAFDRAFVEHMSAHHHGAVDSAKAIKNVAPHVEVRELAGDIIAEQSRELTLMASWRLTP